MLNENPCGKSYRRAALRSLSNREMEVLNCLANGNTVSEAANLLASPERSVRELITSIIDKLDARTAIDVVSILLLRAGLGEMANANLAKEV